MTPIKLPDAFKQYGNILFKGGLIEAAPSIAAGMLVELLKKQQVDVEKASKWVQGNTIIWKLLEPKQQAMLKKLSIRVGNIDWLDINWAINALRGELPALASLFLGWKKANNWLRRQIEIIRAEVKGE